MKYKIRCSSLDRILNCSFSLRLPQESSESSYATYGTDQHLKAQEYLEGENDGEELDLNTLVYCEFVKTFKGMCFIENKLSYEYSDFILSGTPDFFSISDDNTATIVDLKTGYMLVDPKKSSQLMGYASLIAHKFNLTSINLVIVQNNTVKEHSVDMLEILCFEKELEEEISLLSHVEGEHCGFCPSKIHCSKKIGGLEKLNENEPIDFDNLNLYIDIIRNKSSLIKTIEDIENYLKKNHEELFYWKERKMKYWIDKDNIPHVSKPLSPTQALKIDANFKDNIGIKINKYLKLKD